jgi:hypothetical protein
VDLICHRGSVSFHEELHDYDSPFAIAFLAHAINDIRGREAMMGLATREWG